MRTPWSSPISNTLQSVDAARLQQIFISLSFELSEMRKDIDELKKMVASQNRRDYGVRP
jgi:hypothetical protein